MDLYHVDKKGELQPDTELTLEVEPPQNLPSHSESIAEINRMFPRGLTPYGFNIVHGFWDEHPQTCVNEFSFEMYRRQYAPEKPSRLQTVFAVDSVSDAKQYCDTQLESNQTLCIYRISADNYSGPHYMEHLCAPTLGIGLSQARSYWRSLPNMGLREYLLEPPVMVQEKVEEHQPAPSNK